MHNKQYLFLGFIVGLAFSLFLPMLFADDWASSTSNYSHSQYQYLVVYEAGGAEERTEVLNKYSQNGWKLVAVEDNRLYLERKSLR